MKISTKGRYALRLMLDLALNSNGTAVPLKEVAERQGISDKYLEQIVTQLERGEAPLDESLALFEEGMKLANNCSKQLDKAEQAVVKLTKTADGSPAESPLEEQG